MISKTFTREELYNLVWQKPINPIAKEFGYKEKEIREICVKHNIPLSKMGYWSKLKFNKEVTKSPLLDPENQKSVIWIDYDKDVKVCQKRISESIKDW